MADPLDLGAYVELAQCVDLIGAVANGIDVSTLEESERMAVRGW